jgi:AbrB family looped-hinge helix DNA binding protein
MSYFTAYRERVMDIARVSSKGQIVIPKALRDAHRIRTGDRLIVSSTAGELRLKPAPVIGSFKLEDVAGMLHQAIERTPSEAEIKTEIEERLFAEDAATKSFPDRALP